MKFPAALSAALVLEFWRPGNARLKAVSVVLGQVFSPWQGPSRQTLQVRSTFIIAAMQARTFH